MEIEHMRILIVEDEPDLLANLAQAVREEDFAVDLRKKAGRPLPANQQTTCHTSRRNAPEIDGWQVPQKLRRQKRTPVLMLTARDSIADRVHGLDTGADDYLTKPFDLNELLARLRALIRRSAGDPSPLLRIQDLEINTAAKCVSLSGQLISLTSREYALLEYLAHHHGQVVSRTILYEHLFDEDDTSLSNLLDVHVSNLRKKLGSSIIKTRRGLGYCIEA